MALVLCVCALREVSLSFSYIRALILPALTLMMESKNQLPPSGPTVKYDQIGG